MYTTESLTLPDNIEKPLFYSPLADTTPSASGNLPHWEQTGKTVFVTFRLADSLPQNKLSEWLAIESEWMSRVRHRVVLHIRREVGHRKPLGEGL